MDRKQILDYLSRIIAFEKVLAVQKNTITYTENKIKKLAYDYDLERFQREQQKNRSDLKEIFFKKDRLQTVLTFIVIATILGAILGFIIGYFLNFLNGDKGINIECILLCIGFLYFVVIYLVVLDYCWFDDEMCMIVIGLEFIASGFIKAFISEYLEIPFLGIFIILASITFFIPIVVRDLKNRKYNKNVMLQHKADLLCFKKEKKEVDKKVDELKMFLSKCKKNYESTRIILTKLYDLNIMNKRFHNDIVAVCSFYQYFDLEICDSFGGANGAYNLYLNDLKYRRIIVELKAIREELESIRKNQEVLYDTLTSINVNSKKIQNYIQDACEDQKAILENQHLINYNTYNANCNLEILKWIKVFQA